LAQKLAMENEHVTADVVEASEFPELSQRYRVMSVPKMVVNEKFQFLGALPEDRYLKEVMKAVPDGK